MMVHVDLICVKFEGQVHRSQNKTATTTVASAARAVNVYTAGDLWWMWLISDRNLLWLNVVLKWSVEPGLKAFLVIGKFTVWVVIIIIHMPVFMVLSSWPKPLREFTQFIWWMQYYYSPQKLILTLPCRREWKAELTYPLQEWCAALAQGCTSQWMSW